MSDDGYEKYVVGQKKSNVGRLENKNKSGGENDMSKDYGVQKQHGSRGGARVFAGSVHPVALVGLFVFFLSSIAYVYALNLGAVQGYEARKVESDIAVLKEENRKLKISEAQTLSLSRIEEAAKGREMDRTSEMHTVGGRGVVAIR